MLLNVLDLDSKTKEELIDEIEKLIDEVSIRDLAISILKLNNDILMEE